MNKFSIEDEVHAEWQGDFVSFEYALEELVRRSKLPWNEEPNRCPCIGWEKCERLYTITEFIVGDETFTPQSEVEVLSVSYQGVHWSKGYEYLAEK